MLNIKAMVSLSAMGAIRNAADRKKLWSDSRAATQWNSESEVAWAPIDGEVALELAQQEGKRWQRGADSITKMALWLGQEIREDIEKATSTGIVMASSRGAAQSLESAFQNHAEGKRIHPLTSPWTTLGSTAAWMARDLGLSGATIDTSMTCSSGLNALYQAAALLKSGMQQQMLVGAVEAPLSPFGLAQFSTLGVLSKKSSSPHCLPFHQASGNTMTMGEGGALLVLDQGKEGLAKIKSIGIGRENFEHPAAIADDGKALAQAMKNCIDQCRILPDAIVPHAPGTLQGDQAEMNAIERVFGSDLPPVLSPKWKIGHTFGASGLLGIDLAIHLLQGGEFPQPYVPEVKTTMRTAPRHVMVNATGFGGNALSVLVAL